MYIDYKYYQSLHSDPLTEQDFNRLAWEACRKIDIATTGADNVKKLKIAFPTDEDDAEAVKRCAAQLVSILYKLEEAEKSLNSAQGYIQREDGSFQGKVVSSVSAGNESISYSTGHSSGTVTMIDKALTDEAVQKQLFSDTIADCLSGITDANGVNLLYMGDYPYRLRKNEGL